MTFNGDIYMTALSIALKQHVSYLDEMKDLEQLDVNLKDEGETWWKEQP